MFNWAGQINAISLTIFFQQADIKHTKLYIYFRKYTSKSLKHTNSYNEYYWRLMTIKLSKLEIIICCTRQLHDHAIRTPNFSTEKFSTCTNVPYWVNWKTFLGAYIKLEYIFHYLFLSILKRWASCQLHLQHTWVVTVDRLWDFEPFQGMT